MILKQCWNGNELYCPIMLISAEEKKKMFFSYNSAVSSYSNTRFGEGDLAVILPPKGIDRMANYRS